jgi:hypothetical protein
MLERVALVGTTKGLFVLRGKAGGDWALDGAALAGEEVYAAGVHRHDGRVRLLAGSVSMHWGPVLRLSDDLGGTWREDEGGARVVFPEDTGAALARVWQLYSPGDAEPGVVYAGVEPAALFRSTDGGETFELIRGLWDHPHRAVWEPGGGGLCLHTVLADPRDPRRLTVAISAAGVYRSDDGGASWRPSNSGIRAVFLPEPDVEFGQCVHKVGRDAANPDTMFLQHHWGVYRSDDSGDTWAPIGGALPSDFGFPIVVHPRRAGTAYVIPLQSDEYRCTPEGRCRVYRTDDGGGSWTALTDGLPQEDAHLTVLRDGFCADDGDPAGLWFGTRTGEVFASFDDGDSWTSVAGHLPPVLTVRAVAV